MDVDFITSIANELAADNDGWGTPEFIDAGASGAVFSMEHPTHGMVALKIYDPKFFQGENALIEEHRVQLQTQLAHLNHANLIRTFSAAAIPAHNTWYLLMEFCPWRSLEKVVAEVPDTAVPSLIRQLAEVTLFLAEAGLVHRDIKPANIAVSDDFTSLKLLDLGVLRKIAPDEANGTDLDEKRRFVATAQYSPPEYVAREESPGEEGFSALNVYQVGAVLHDLLMKRPLFEDEAGSLNRFILYKAILQKRPTVFNSSVPAKLNSICRAALHKNPASRTKAVKLADFMSAAESADTLRRRLGAKRKANAAPPACPSVLVWKDKVAAWVASAAGAEREVLGAFTFREVSCRAECLWELRFDDHGMAIRVRLSPSEHDVLALRFEGPKDCDAGFTVLEIADRGPNIPREQIGPQLQEQMLVALDTLPDAAPADETDG